MITIKASLVIFCLLGVSPTGSPEFDGGTFFMENLEGEVWKPIPGYGGVFQASSLGRIKALERRSPGKFGSTRILKEKFLSQTKNNLGYLHVTIGNSKGSTKVHRVVCFAFYGKSNLPVDHINGDKSDNRLENLQYLTNRENIQKYWRGREKSSKYIGVCYHKASKKWMATIQINGKAKYLGLYNTEILASEAHKIEMSKING